MYGIRNGNHEKDTSRWKMDLNERRSQGPIGPRGDVQASIRKASPSPVEARILICSCTLFLVSPLGEPPGTSAAPFHNTKRVKLFERVRLRKKSDPEVPFE